jgi:5-methylcytosine-specific restriction endonuclease McrA
VPCQKVHKAKYNGPWAKLSSEMRARYPWCWYCGTRTGPFQLDHVIAGSTEGGVAVACRKCNGKKSNGPAPAMRFGPNNPPPR